MDLTKHPLALGQRVRLLPGDTVAEYAGLAFVRRRDDLPLEPLAVVHLSYEDAGYLQPREGDRPQTFVSMLLVHPDNIAIAD